MELDFIVFKSLKGKKGGILKQQKFTFPLKFSACRTKVKSNLEFFCVGHLVHPEITEKQYGTFLLLFLFALSIALL